MEKGRWGIGRLKGVMNWMLIPLIALFAARLIRKQSVAVMMSVVNGTYFLAASLASRWTNTPLILIVHDDWVPIVSRVLPVPPGVFQYLMGRALRRASRVFVVSAGMQDMLKTQYRVDSEIQMPATDPWPTGPYPDAEKTTGAFRILYMGNGVSAQDSLTLLIDLVREKTLRNYGLDDVELRLCAPFQIDDPAIKQCGWVSEGEARREISAADVLFLPYSFTSEDRPLTLTSFPAKSADYFASGKPILVLGPKDSTIVRYAEQFHCAEVVTELNRDAVAQAICRLASGSEYSQQLAMNAHRAFEANHNIQRQQERLCEVVRELARKP
jgi:glycosyltransferase involved in cell wall biosynthesis